MAEILVKYLMTQDPVTVKPDTNLLECSKTLIKKRVGSLLLVDKNKLMGFISSHDIIWAIVKKSKEDLEKIKAIDISPKKLATTRPNATVKEVVEKMKRLKFERLPVIENGNLVGIITARDILNFHPELFHEFEEFKQIREQSQKLKKIKTLKENDYGKEGICEACGAKDILFRFNGMLVCEDCKNDL